MSISLDAVCQVIESQTLTILQFKNNERTRVTPFCSQAPQFFRLYGERYLANFRGMNRNHGIAIAPIVDIHTRKHAGRIELKFDNGRFRIGGHRELHPAGCRWQG